MPAIEVAKLKLRCDTRQLDRARFVIEDALRTEIPDENRLILVRTMQLREDGSSPHPARRQAAMRDGWLAATAGARHGSENTAGSANCVWFASRDEAETLLLARLLAGLAADGWFWKLALPDWRRRPVEAWLGDCLVECLASQDDRRLLRIVETCLTAGAVDRLVEALVQSGRRASAAVWQPEGGGYDSRASFSPERQFAPDLPDSTARFRPRSPELPPALREAVTRLWRSDSRAQPAVRAIFRAVALRRSPALALAPALLDEAVTASITEIAGNRVIPAPRASENSDRGASIKVAPGTPDDIPAESKTPAFARNEALSPNEPTRPSQSPRPLHPEPAREAARPDAIETPRLHQHSRHAGLWLVMPSLNDMGFRDWLADRPALLEEHPGRLLLLAIARRHRVPAGDPVLTVLGEPDVDAKLPPWTELWRHGLDRWLRRRARRRLHDLVNRPGELDWDEMRLDIRFPSGDADIRLRRLALDRDPGWTDWLGLSIRYHFTGGGSR